MEDIDRHSSVDAVSSHDRFSLQASTFSMGKGSGKLPAD